MDIEIECAIDNATNLQDRQSLTIDESAALHIYTQESELYPVLNARLRLANRIHLRPLMFYLKLLTTALGKLDTIDATVFRGVKLDLTNIYLQGKNYIWWDVSSCTQDANVLKYSNFCGDSGNRTIFTIQNAQGVSIKVHSAIPNEDEFVLMPGSKLYVKAVLPLGNGLTMMQCTYQKNMLRLKSMSQNINTIKEFISIKEEEKDVLRMMMIYRKNLNK